MRQRVLDALYRRGTLVEPDAADFLCGRPDALEWLEHHLLSGSGAVPMILTLNDLKGLMGIDREGDMEGVNVLMKACAPVDKLAHIGIGKDITGKSTCVGDIADFLKLFQDRYRTLKRLLMRRREVQGSVSISKARRLEKDVKIIGMVSSVRTTKNGHRMIELEDEEDATLVLILKGSPASSEHVINDEVIGVVGSTAKRGEMIIANEIVRPDIPINSAMKQSDVDTWAVFAGDVHVGSNTFLENQWRGFLDWLKSADEARDVRYLVMPGDLVDGIGVYPDQEDELLVDDVYRQYEILAEYLKDVRDDIAIVACPGNHDAVRLAEPQPALPSSISRLFDSNVKIVGNPAQVSLEGRSVLLYHGRSIDDWIGALPGLSYERPLEVMREMLRRRHLAPIYGGRTAIAPEQKDYLLIDDVPDIFVTGHVHSAGLGDYRGVIMINASAWQDQTAFQKMHNHVPDPCKAFMIHLGNGKARMVKFT